MTLRKIDSETKTRKWKIRVGAREGWRRRMRGSKSDRRGLIERPGKRERERERERRERCRYRVTDTKRKIEALM